MAARYFGCAPWELLEQLPIWTDWAITAQWAEAEAYKRDHPHAS